MERNAPVWAAALVLAVVFQGTHAWLVPSSAVASMAGARLGSTAAHMPLARGRSLTGPRRDRAAALRMQAGEEGAPALDISEEMMLMLAMRERQNLAVPEGSKVLVFGALGAPHRAETPVARPAPRRGRGAVPHEHARPAQTASASWSCATSTPTAATAHACRLPGSTRT